MRERGREDWIIRLVNRKGRGEEAIRVFSVKGGHVQKERGIIMRV